MKHVFSAILCLLLSGSVVFGQQNSQPAANAPAASSTQDAPVDPLLDVPPYPNSPVTLIGGTVMNIDRVRNKLTVEPFGGKKMKVIFDERTHIYRDSAETTQLGIRKGDRVYVDTQLDGTRVFARNIRVQTTSGPADARGQIMNYDSERGVVTVRDELSAEPIRFRVDTNTAVRGKGRSATDLLPGALVSVRFAPQAGAQGVAQEIDITARPGEAFTFAGKVTYLDLSRGIMAVRNQTDDKSYEIALVPGTAQLDHLGVGADVVVKASYDGAGYKAQNISVSPSQP